mmetsp:Transcript_34616/g.66989  ORF Transcript_34616/g.66989 Transcript_34616/m.66989 type:complete len:217 (-) Transcript_34616:203-853(-)
MNKKVHVLPEVEVDEAAKTRQAEAVLQALLHTIIFNRSLHLNSLTPRDMDCDIFEISYAQSDKKDVAQKVTEGIREVLKKMTQKNGQGACVRVCLSFYIPTEKTRLFWTTTEKYHWEKWMIRIRIVRSLGIDAKKTDGKKMHKRRQELLRASLGKIISVVNDDRDHIPPLDITEDTKKLGCFPFDISYIGQDNTTWGSIGNAFIKTLEKPPKMDGF